MVDFNQKMTSPFNRGLIWSSETEFSINRHINFDLLESEYEIDADIGDYKSRPDIPAEFRSDEWWRKRDL